MSAAKGTKLSNNNDNTYLAIGNNGASVICTGADRSEAYEVAKQHPRFNNQGIVGLVNMVDLATNFGLLARRVNVTSYRDLTSLLTVVATPPEQVDEAIKIELARRTFEPIYEPDIRPFNLDAEKLASQVEQAHDAKWYDSPDKDSRTVVELFNAALRPDVIDLPTLDDEPVTIGLLYMAPQHHHSIGTDVFLRLYSSVFEHIVGDVLPLEGCEFFERAVEIAGVEEGVEYAKAILNIVLEYFAQIYRNLGPYMLEGEREAAGLVSAPTGEVV